MDTIACVNILADEIDFDLLVPHLVAPGIISEKRKDEYLQSLGSNHEKFSVLILKIFEQGIEIQRRFLQTLDNNGFETTSRKLQSHFDADSSLGDSNSFDEIQMDGCCGSKSAINYENDDNSGDIIDEELKSVVIKTGEKFYSPSEHKIYLMGSKPKGLALIIVNKKFWDDYYELRNGAERDLKNLIALFKGLGFETEDHFNKTASEMRKIIRKFSQLSSHDKVDSCVVAISSHGETNQVVGVDNECIRIEEILDKFNNENNRFLMGKPKLFFLQACRGRKSDGGVSRDNSADGGMAAMAVNHKLLKPNTRSPKWTDMVIAYSTIPEYVAIRNERLGSWFIQAVTGIFAENAWNTPLSELFHLVTELMETYQTNEGEKQIPEIAHRGWKKDLYFNPGLYKP